MFYIIKVINKDSVRSIMLIYMFMKCCNLVYSNFILLAMHQIPNTSTLTTIASYSTTSAVY